MKPLIAIALMLATALASCAPATAAEPPRCGYVVRHAYPHDATAFTEGLFYRQGMLFESTGIEGRSTIRRVRLGDGAVVDQVALPATLFGEGIVDWGNELLSVTWRGGAGFRWTIDGFRQTGRFSYPGEGWGMTNDGRSVILSDGSATLRLLDPVTMRERRRLAVTANGVPVRQLNELEYVRGEILANVWQTDQVARIDAATGRVKAWIDLDGLREAAGGRGPGDVANGIAWDRVGKRLFVTGKNWSKLFEIGLITPARARGRRGQACPVLGR